MSWRRMRVLRDSVEAQHRDLELCEAPEDYVRWLGKHRPDLLAQFPARIQRMGQPLSEAERIAGNG
jgi:hypothetical protein